MDADYSDLPDDELKEERHEVQRRLRVIEQEMARRREARHGAPYWWCESCQCMFRDAEGKCYNCGSVSEQKLKQAEVIHE